MKLDHVKVLWAEQLRGAMVVSHHPHSTTWETPFTPAYEANSMLQVEINVPWWRCSHFNEEENEVGLRYVVGLIDDIRDVTHIREFVAKQKASRINNSKVIQIEMQECNLLSRQVLVPTQQRKLQPNWRGNISYIRSFPTEPTSLKSWMNDTFSEHGTYSI